MKVYHILNGDSLFERWPKEIAGECIVDRECLVDGDVNGDTLEELYQTRATYLSEHYSDVSSEEYYLKTVPEINRMLDIPEHSEINLWFEDDLFCQVNLWFVINLLSQQNRQFKTYLVRPNRDGKIVFSYYNESGLLDLYQQRQKLEPLSTLSKLWVFYQEDNFHQLERIATHFALDYPFLLPAVEAHVARIPTSNYKGRPTETLIQLIKEFNTENFGVIFKAFCERESIYGYGDLQVKRLFDAIKSS